MQTLKALFTAHPRSVGETYLEHLAAAFSFGARLTFAGLACVLHGVLPFLFVNTGSSTVRRLHIRMATRAPSVRAAPEWADRGAYI